MAQVIREVNRASYAALSKLAQNLDLKVGWFSTNWYPAIASKKPGGKGKPAVPVAYIATIHEHGHLESGIPARPFMQPTIDREETNWRDFLAVEIPRVLAGATTLEDVLEALGLNVAGEIAQSIRNVDAPPLKPATIAAKRRKMADQNTVGNLSKPLVETGIMLDTVSHTVTKSSLGVED